jgi:DNA-binding FadR family transcriptional regulator
VVREAMQHLRAMGLVHTRHGIGSFVLDAWPPLRLHGDACAPGGTRHLMAMLELRISVETEAAALAAVRRSEAQLDGMRQALQAFAAAAQAGHNTLKADFQFHRLIAQATGNPYFEDVLDSLGRHTIAGALPRPDDPAQFSPSGQPRLLAGKELTAHEHEAILDALQRGDALGARAAMLVHLGNSRGRLRRAIA